MSEDKKSTFDDDKKIKVSTLVYTVLIIVIIIVGIGGILAYGPKTKVGDKVSARISKAIPYPAAIVDWRNPVYLGDVESNLASIEKFYASQDQNLSKEGLRVDFTTPDGKKRLKIKEKEVLDKLIEDKIIEILAKQKGISVPQKDIDQAVNSKLNEMGTTNDVKDDLYNSYGWSLDDFKNKVVMPSVYENALSLSISEKDLNNSKPKQKILEAQKQLENGKDFAEVVKNYSEGASKDNGGKLGWVKKEQLVLELQTALFGSNLPVKNSIIESSIGFHIVDIESKKKEGNDDVLQLRQIYVAKSTFTDWLADQKKQMSVWVPLSGYAWNSQTGSVDFEDSQMRAFEKDQQSKAQGDASIMF